LSRNVAVATPGRSRIRTVGNAGSHDRSRGYAPRSANGVRDAAAFIEDGGVLRSIWPHKMFTSCRSVLPQGCADSRKCIVCCRDKLVGNPRRALWIYQYARRSSAKLLRGARVQAWEKALSVQLSTAGSTQRRPSFSAVSNTEGSDDTFVAKCHLIGALLSDAPRR
jgi:hypothetical protein